MACNRRAFVAGLGAAALAAQFRPLRLLAGTADRLAWQRSAKLGMFIHWGPYSVAGVEASWPIMAPSGEISEADYRALPARADSVYVFVMDTSSTEIVIKGLSRRIANVRLLSNGKHMHSPRRPARFAFRFPGICGQTGFLSWRCTNHWKELSTEVFSNDRRDNSAGLRRDN